jgi:hypothetical protein
MKPRLVSKVSLDATKSLVVALVTEPGETFEYIYREANGLRWDSALRALHAYEPQRWEPTELLCHVATTLRSAFSEDLQFSKDTLWEGVSLQLQELLRSALPTASGTTSLPMSHHSEA